MSSQSLAEHGTDFAVRTITPLDKPVGKGWSITVYTERNGALQTQGSSRLGGHDPVSGSKAVTAEPPFDLA